MTRLIDVCNGDADGLCALHQLRLAQPAGAQLVTGLKRDIELLARVHAGNDDRITVADISLARNRAALDRLLAQGAHVRWFDHHFAGEVPSHPAFEAHIDTAPDVCTSILVDRFLSGRFRPWAIVAAFGDNLARPARALAGTLGLSAEQVAVLCELGEAMNYNSYGDTDDDVLIHPAALYARLQGQVDPWQFATEPIVRELVEGRRADLAHADRLAPVVADPQCAVFELPDVPWARRVLGTFAHQLASAHPERAHAVLKDNGEVNAAETTYTVSVRAPIAHPGGADALCRRFDGGGRAGAAGIDRLPRSKRESFIAAFRAMRWMRDAQSR